MVTLIIVIVSSSTRYSTFALKNDGNTITYFVMHKIQHMDMAQPEQICSITQLLDNAKTANMDRDNEWLITQPFFAGLFWGRTHGRAKQRPQPANKVRKVQG